MTPYPFRVRNNILPLSVAETLPEAFEEWSFTYRTIDHEDASESCQLCEKESLRYHFQIKNSLTGKLLWVGSQCILKFGLSIFEGNHRLSPADAKKKLDRLLDQMRLDSCIRALEMVAIREKSDILASALDYYHLNKCSSPKYAFVVLAASGQQV